jgi:hypothetical protein
MAVLGGLLATATLATAEQIGALLTGYESLFEKYQAASRLSIKRVIAT